MNEESWTSPSRSTSQANEETTIRTRTRGHARFVYEAFDGGTTNEAVRLRGVFLFARAPPPYPSSLSFINSRFQRSFRASRLSMVTRSYLYHISSLYRHSHCYANCWIHGEPFNFFFLGLGFWGYARRIWRDGRCSGALIRPSMSDARL